MCSIEKLREQGTRLAKLHVTLKTEKSLGMTITNLHIIISSFCTVSRAWIILVRICSWIRCQETEKVQSSCSLPQQLPHQGLAVQLWWVSLLIWDCRRFKHVGRASEDASCSCYSRHTTLCVCVATQKVLGGQKAQECLQYCWGTILASSLHVGHSRYFKYCTWKTGREWPGDETSTYISYMYCTLLAITKQL